MFRVLEGVVHDPGFAWSLALTGAQSGFQSNVVKLKPSNITPANHNRPKQCNR